VSGARKRAQPPEDQGLDVIVAPWSYNPSSWRQRIPICLLSMVAFLIATHLALFQWGLIETVWDPVFGEQSARVIGSDVADMMHSWFGIPDAALGALAYLGDAVFGLAGSTRRWQYRPWMVILFGIDVIPLGLVSVILVLCQAFVLGQWCFLCLVTAGISLILVYLAYDEVYSSLKYLYAVWKKTGSIRTLWFALWGLPDSDAEQAASELVQLARSAA
jgi:hypothetical protein